MVRRALRARTIAATGTVAGLAGGASGAPLALQAERAG
jgi:hypothetical protein